MENQTVFVEEINFKELQFLEVISFPYNNSMDLILKRKKSIETDVKAGLLLS